MARPKRQEDPLLPVPLPRRRPSRANTRNLAASVKPELAAEIKNLAAREQTSVAALVEEATINLLKARGIESPDSLRHSSTLASRARYKRARTLILAHPLNFSPLSRPDHPLYI